MFTSVSPLQDWKGGRAAVGKVTPKYKATPEDDTPIVAEVPGLNICTHQDGELQIPPEIRGQFMGDPCRAPEWRRLLQEFDQRWGSTSVTGATPKRSPPNTSPNTSPSPTGASPTGADASETGGGAAFWDGIFPGEPRSKDAFTEKYPTICHTFVISPTCVAQIVEGPKLFLLSTGATEVGSDTPVITYGAGTWLLDAKALNYMQD